jgi:hypothetical protein
MKVFVIGFISIMVSACSTIKPYEKEYLLNPLMDDQVSTALTPSMPSAATTKFEKFASGANGGAGSSCPTCGG